MLTTTKDNHQCWSRRRLLGAAAGAGLLGAAGLPLTAAASVPAGKARIAALPGADTILFYVAESLGFFKEQGLDVEVLPFKSALEMSAAVRAGKAAGQYNNIITNVAQRANGMDLSFMATTWHTTPKHRCFGLAVAPQEAQRISSIEELKKLSGVTTANSKGTLPDWVLDQLVETQHLAPTVFRTVEVAQVPIRLQMLITGKLQTAIFYEPLLTFIEAKGGKVIWDDRELNAPLTGVSLAQPYLVPEFVTGFRKALAQAAAAVDAEPKKFYSLMVKKSILPPVIADKYDLKPFRVFSTPDGLPPLPTPEFVEGTAQWLVKKGILKTKPDIKGTIYYD